MLAFPGQMSPGLHGAAAQSHKGAAENAVGGILIHAAQYFAHIGAAVEFPRGIREAPFVMLTISASLMLPFSSGTITPLSQSLMLWPRAPKIPVSGSLKVTVPMPGNAVTEPHAEHPLILV